ncbi:MAG: SDR family NAD(P)-dependent oxidoreductase [Actinomycetota bacterium]
MSTTDDQTKTILLTGASDGIGLETAMRLAALGHQLLLHGRNEAKLDAAVERVRSATPDATIETHLADLSNLVEVDALAASVAERHDRLDVLINNAGIFKTSAPLTADGLDVRFVVNTIAPYRLTTQLLPIVPASGRIVNLSSAAQAPVDRAAMVGETRLADMDAYAQSKLAITMWSRHLAEQLGADGPAVIAVNPGSLLATKMVKEGFGVAGSDIGIGADILVRAALSDEFAAATGRYWDNDSGRFAPPHPDGLDPARTGVVVDDVARLAASLAGAGQV